MYGTVLERYGNWKVVLAAPFTTELLWRGQGGRNTFTMLSLFSANKMVDQWDKK